MFNKSSAEAFGERSNEEIREAIMYILLSLTVKEKRNVCVSVSACVCVCVRTVCGVCMGAKFAVTKYSTLAY